MNLNTAHKILNPILLTLFITQVASGLLSTKISFKTFIVFHEYGAYVLSSAVILHLILNYRWVKASYFKK
jgi:hypothetical protein